MNMKSKILLMVFWCMSLHFIGAQSSDDVTISILTCAPGKEIYSIYGHNAIRVYDKKSQSDVVYNYGTFDDQTPNFVLKFMKGRLPYWISASDYGRFLREYQYFGRPVMEQVLDIDSLQKQKIISYLEENMKPENKAYKYDFFMDNCATRLRDILDDTVDGLTWNASGASGKTFRQIIKGYQAQMPWTDFGIDLIIGAPADRVTTLAEESFIPDYLSNAISEARCNGAHPLQKSVQEVLTFDTKSSASSLVDLLISPYFLFILLLFIEINLFFRHLRGLANSKWIKRYDLLWLVVISMSSMLMLFMWFGTDHIPTKYNWNVLWASPLIPVWWWIKNKFDEKGKYLRYIIAFMILVSMANAIPGIQFLPQYFHPIVGIIGGILLLKGYRVK
jgi:hypothetical protein